MLVTMKKNPFFSESFLLIRYKPNGNSAINHISPIFPRTKISTAIQRDEEYMLAPRSPPQKPKNNEPNKKKDTNDPNRPRNKSILSDIADENPKM